MGAEGPDRLRTSLLTRLLRRRLGIAGHLSLSFIAVAMLAGAFNLLTQQGVAIIEIRQIQTLPAPVVETPAPIQPQPRSDSAPAPTDAKTDLRIALEAFARNAMQRALAPGADIDRQFERSKQTLETEHSRQSGARNAGLRRALLAFGAAGAELVVLADRHRAVASAYEQDVAAIDEQLTDASERGWRILGRVLAHEPLLRLRNHFGEIRRLSLELSGAEAPSQAAIDATIASELAFARTLEENERSFRRAESAEWIANMQAASARVVLLRESLLASWNTLASAELAFAQAGNRAKTLAEAAAAAPPPPAKPAEPATPFVGPPVPPEREFVGPPVLAPLAVPESRVETHQADEGKQRLVAVVTAAVLLAVLLISIGTVRSIVVPIRRLLRATARLARGEHEPVPRGGIKELDDLGQAFNRMAADLVDARKSSDDYRSELEARVAERTQQLRDLAERDPVTGLPNRRHLLRLIDQMLETARTADQRVGLVFLDVDNFKNVNDSMGHAFGDLVLLALARRLETAVASIGVAARLGGDEFTVVIPDARDAEHFGALGARIVAAFQSPLRIEDRELIVSVSAGASIFPLHADDAPELLKAADAALFRAKALGRNRLSIFTPELLAEAAAKFTTEQALRHAIERGEFELVFQPEIDAATGSTALVEALLRWRLPDGRLATPSEFLSVAEESGLIAEISDWVVSTAIEAAARWHHGAWPEARVAINVSARQLLDTRFVDKIETLLTRHRLPARCIEIELTETVLQSGAATANALHALAKSGFAIALDDFGSGYSSLASLEKLPFTRVKLDRSLIDGIATSVRSASIARAIIWLCHSLNVEVTAEGVETREQLAMLSRFRPMHLQGYLLARPVAVEHVIATIESLRPHVALLLAETNDQDRHDGLNAERRGFATIEAA